DSGGYMETVLYDMHPTIFKLIREIPWSLLLFVFLGGYFLYLGFAKWEENDNAELHIIFGFLFGGVGIWLFGSALVALLQLYPIIHEAYYGGYGEYVEGYVEDFSPGNVEEEIAESFVIDGVYFDYYNMKTMFGYNKYASMGGVIKGNGQHLKIRYFDMEGEPGEVGLNMIVYIAEIKDEGE
ncbi:MAG: hypothetical protein IJM26_05910, partial [Lachnospiraceae bacterium]|nr:hypothetical protein [Lachnospiraceae bacterium]